MRRSASAAFASGKRPTESADTTSMMLGAERFSSRARAVPATTETTSLRPPSWSSKSARAVSPAGTKTSRCSCTAKPAICTVIL